MRGRRATFSPASLTGRLLSGRGCGSFVRPAPRSRVKAAGSGRFHMVQEANWTTGWFPVSPAKIAEDHEPARRLDIICPYGLEEELT